MTDRPPLTPANPREVAERIAFSLRYRRDGKATKQYNDALHIAAAEHITEMLRVSGFVVMKGPPAAAHSAHGATGKQTPEGGE